ncbi:MAG TPA: metal-dependent hydrolase [Chthoniobacterales bacterium]|jgi:L-ascorbate metabolism protein UlaG (beta-lactamase superfamily)|nr:metal-dependent hydrolase [Chthoniobacterales bacterium]
MKRNMAQTQLTWYGQSSYKIETPGGKTLLIDPWLTNPVFDKAKETLAALKHVDLILLTHGHGDHVGDSVEIAKKTGAKLVANVDLAAAVVSVLGYPADKAGAETIGHIGGEITLLDGDVKVCFVPAMHGSTVRKDENSPPVAAGMPTGLVVSIRNGPTIYHTGDTGFFSDMAKISDHHKIDIMLVCIGDHYTMGPVRAAEAVKLVGPKMAIPNHYRTFPVLTGTPEAFAQELKKCGAKSELRVMEVGETITV